MALPLLAAPDDIRGIVRFLARKPAGASVRDTEARLGAEYVDPRKIAAYQRLGILMRENDQLKLTPDIGRELARADDLGFADRLRHQLGTIPAYEACLEWAYERGLSDLTSSDVGAFWHDHHSDELGTSNERQIAERATCFLKLCEGAGLGTFVVGRRGQPTRLAIDREAIEAFVHSREFSNSAWQLDNSRADSAIDEREQHETNGEAASVATRRPNEPLAESLGQAIFVGHGKNKTPLEQLKSILEGFKIPFKIAAETPNLGRPISEKVAQIMRECNCAILIFTADEEFMDKEGNSVWRPSENVIHELGASSFLYGKRIVILKEQSVQLPTNFRDIGYIEFARDALAAQSMDVLKELIGFGIVKVTT